VGFQYAASWLRASSSFAIDPSLPMVEHLLPFPGRRLPSVFADTAPDAWGELLLRRRAGRDLDAWQLMVGVADTTRMGALRLREKAGPYISSVDPPVPPLARLRDLQEAARRFEDDPDGDIDDVVGLLLAPGSSLGGARPKANYVAPDGRLWIAKFPSRTDRRDVGAWEHVYARMAAAAAIDVPETGLLQIGDGARTFVTQRFDRAPDGRRLYASALTQSGRTTTTGADYADIARAVSATVAPQFVMEDLRQLYRRMAFNVIAGNRDDHLRNHGFLRTPDGWRLAPAFDMNPAREMRDHATAVNGRVTAIGPDDVIVARSQFRLSTNAASDIVRDVADVVGTWREVAREAGISRAEQDRVGRVLGRLSPDAPG
jgi:serine/threonine-protein kinase HipA